MEIFVDRRADAKSASETPRPTIVWPTTRGGARSACDWLRPFLKSDGALNAAPGKIAALVAAWPSAPAHVRRGIRVSRHFGSWLEREQRQRARVKARARFLAEIEQSKASFELVRLPLLPYQREGMLRLPYAFVLTGTPLENRIDELYSIVQYLDPELIGPLFRFNREYYDLDDRGRPVNYKNLAGLRDRVAPVMLRRRKADVESELPGRTVTNYFVPMAEEQRTRYEEYKAQAARSVAIARRRPLLPKEFERLQLLLACMRMICDTPAILDPACRVCPKLERSAVLSCCN